MAEPLLLLENPFDKEVMLFPFVWEGMGILYTIQRYLQNRNARVIKTNIEEIVEKDLRFDHAKALMLTTAVNIRQYEQLFAKLKSRGVVLPDHDLQNPSVVHDMYYYYPICAELGIKQPKTFFYRLLEDYFELSPHEIETLKAAQKLASAEKSLVPAMPKNAAEILARPSDGLTNLRRRAKEAGFSENGRYFVRGTVSSFKYLRKDDTVRKSPAVQFLLRLGMALKAHDRENRLLDEVMAALDGIRGDEKLPDLALANSLTEAYKKIETIGLHLIAQGLVNENGFAIREFIDIKNFGRAETVLPLNAEYRAVFYQDEVLSIDLWTPPHLFRDQVPFSVYALSDGEIKYIVSSCKKFARRTGARFFMMDFAKDAAGDLYLIEINPGYFTAVTHEKSKVLFAYWAAKDLLGEKPDEAEYREFLEAYGSKEWFFALNETYLSYLKTAYKGHPKLEELVEKNREYIEKRYAELTGTETVYQVLQGAAYDAG